MQASSDGTVCRRGLVVWSKLAASMMASAVEERNALRH
jgi:hypothetical protein